jgi:hypothetical protein
MVANILWEGGQGFPPAGTPVPLPPALPARDFRNHLRFVAVTGGLK